MQSPFLGIWRNASPSQSVAIRSRSEPGRSVNASIRTPCMQPETHRVWHACSTAGMSCETAYAALPSSCARSWQLGNPVSSASRRPATPRRGTHASRTVRRFSGGALWNSERKRWRRAGSEVAPVARLVERSSNTDGGGVAVAACAAVPALATRPIAARRRAIGLTGDRGAEPLRRSRRRAGAAPRGATGTPGGTAPPGTRDGRAARRSRPAARPGDMPETRSPFFSSSSRYSLLNS